MPKEFYIICGVIGLLLVLVLVVLIITNHKIKESENKINALVSSNINMMKLELLQGYSTNTLERNVIDRMYKLERATMKYDVIIIGAGPGGIFSAYELIQKKPDLKVAIFEAGHALENRHCPIDGDKIKSCIGCKSCSIMSGFGGAGAFSDGKYNITNDFGGTLYEYIGKKNAIDLMKYV